ncbi:hypothetical protein SAMN04488570_1505 [Nocardioides scoriae]|uniref:LysM domain-containing protein n=1 Tax=Nocardioides scoriae TaxID=642780 RepID=A0A1H1QUN7_9ACTN|nr:LysM domain-containing protein [Nocardioides scoriae]SDS27023.1 hypothetical protein SAMN04488570_1505 [Nocardioides scoriae]
MNHSQQPPVDPTTTRFDALVQQAAEVVLAACVAWVVVLVLAALVEATSRGHLPALRWVGCPPVLRRGLLAAVGVAVLAPGLPGPPASAGAPPDPGRGVRTTDTRSGPVRGSWLPVPARPLDARPLDAHRPDTRPADLGPARAPDGPVLVVRPGDSLWSLAHERLPAADAARLVGAVRALHHANRSVVGPDPDLLRPGQLLRWPEAGPHSPRPHHPTTPSRGETS